MISNAKSLVVQNRQFLLYAIIGVSGVLLDLAVFFILFNLVHIDKNVATTISTSAGITNNFFWNAHHNFKMTDRMLRRFLQFYSVGLSGIVLTIIIFQIFVNGLGWSANIVKVLSLGPVLVLQYLLNKGWTFR